MFRFIYRMFNLRTIKSRFSFWLIVLIVITSSLYLITFLVIDKQKRLTDVENFLISGTRSQQTLLGNWLDERTEEINTLAEHLSENHFMIEEMAETLEHYGQLYSQLDALVFVDQDGFVKIDTASEQLTITDSTIDLSDRSYFQAAKDGTHVYEVIHSDNNKPPVIIFATPMTSASDEFQGVLFSAVHLSTINQLLSEALTRETNKFTLLSESGLVISQLNANNHHTPEDESFSEQALQRIKTQASHHQPELLQYTNSYGEGVYGIIQAIDAGKLMLIHEITIDEIMQPYYETIFYVIVIGLAFVGFGLVLMIFITDHLLQPFYYTNQAIRTIATGNYHTQIDLNKFQDSPIEMKQLMQDFNKMAASIESQRQSLVQISKTDSLTGVANRRLFDEHLADQWNLAKSTQQSLSLIFIDVDFFKEFNDHFGHQSGDQCLMSIANTLKAFTENTNYFVARYGGEEFVMILPNHTEKEAKKVAEEIRVAIENLKIARFKNNSHEYVTVSVGVAAMIPEVDNVKEELIQRADQALYIAKTGGRNRVIIASGNE